MLVCQNRLHCFIIGFMELGGQLEVRHNRLDVGASGAMLNGFIVHTVLLQICARTHPEILKDGWDRGNGKGCK